MDSVLVYIVYAQDLVCFQLKILRFTESEITFTVSSETWHEGYSLYLGLL